MTVHRRVPVRALLILTFLVISTNFAAAQSEMDSGPRQISALQDNFNSGDIFTTRFPDAGDGINISTYSMEAGEPGASCTASTLTFSAWAAVDHPGGTLDINTAYSTGTSFDPVVQLFAANTGSLSNLKELGCDDNSGGGSNGNDARLVMPNLKSARYFIRITCIALCASTNDLALAITYTPDEPTPKNDSVSAPKSIKIGKASTTKNVEHTSVASTENLTLSCTMHNTVWYSMTVPTDGTYSFSTFGSILNRPGSNPTDTMLAVYVSSGGASFTNFTLKGCSDDHGGVIGYSGLPAVKLQAGEVIYVRVGTFSSMNMLDGSSYRLKTSIVSLDNVLLNPSFETGTLSPWSMKVTNSIDGVTNIYAFTGSHSARMAGGAGKVNVLKQKWSLDGITLQKGSTAVASLYYSTNGTESKKAVAILSMSLKNGAPAKKTKVKLIEQTGVGSFRIVYLSLPVKPAAVKDFTLTIKNKSPGGLLFIDMAMLRIYGDPLRDAQAPAGVLPPPDAPLPLRGSN